MTKTKNGSGGDNVARELRDTELDRVSGGAPVGNPPASYSSHESTKHPAKITIPDIKL